MKLRLGLAAVVAATTCACATAVPLAPPPPPGMPDDALMSLQAVDARLAVLWFSHVNQGNTSWLEAHLAASTHLTRVSFSMPRGVILDASVLVGVDDSHWQTAWSSSRLAGVNILTVPLGGYSGKLVRVLVHGASSVPALSPASNMSVYGSSIGAPVATPTPAPTPTPTPPPPAPPVALPIAPFVPYQGLFDTVSWLEDHTPWTNLQVDANGLPATPTPAPTATPTPTPAPTDTPPPPPPDTTGTTTDPTTTDPTSTGPASTDTGS